eukprot:9885785-Lingulodinium_polyedra.AAC.1
MRLNRLSIAAAVCESHACAFHARASFLARAWIAQACDLRATAAANGRSDRIFVAFSNVTQRCGRIDRSPPQ